jgi:hypothetical protein
MDQETSIVLSELDRKIKAASLAGIFALVKKLVRKRLGLDQAGILVGLQDLGMSRQGYIGAFYNLATNMIIINRSALATVSQDNVNYYLFHVLLHEYIHAIGSYDESETRAIVEQLTVEMFGQGHVITELARGKTFGMFDIEPLDISVDFVMGIDRENTDYIG